MGKVANSNAPGKCPVANGVLRCVYTARGPSTCMHLMTAGETCTELPCALIEANGNPAAFRGSTSNHRPVPWKRVELPLSRWECVDTSTYASDSNKSQKVRLRSYAAPPSNAALQAYAFSCGRKKYIKTTNKVRVRRRTPEPKPTLYTHYVRAR